MHRIAVLEARIAAVLRSATAPRPAGRAHEPSASYAALTNGNATAAPAPAAPGLLTLVEQRAQLVVQVEQLEREAADLDAAAEALEQD